MSGGAGRARVWRVEVTALSAAAATEARWVLDREETRRAATFVRAADRELYLVAHVALRVVLAQALGRPAHRVEYGRADCPGCGGPHGRPVAVAERAPEFSLSHTDGLALIALADRPVGVDVERRAVFTGSDGPDIAAQLHPAERAALARLPEPRWADALLACWVRKEAHLKGTGIGLADGLAGHHVGFGPESGSWAGPTPAGPAGWGLAGVPVPAGYGAAVALRSTAGTAPQVRTDDLDLAGALAAGRW
ncbi:4'-phosphopantetheinyl transferase superfamily protein [Kitasatospora sp. NBC_00070]|uniref:4'-phosphopantetheinyl transferase family protein n=1 Tax=Kitasatospora sp. NBC_00070 TaxID=2975962 RepID=UPI003248E5E9